MGCEAIPPRNCKRVKAAINPIPLVSVNIGGFPIIPPSSDVGEVVLVTDSTVDGIALLQSSGVMAFQNGFHAAFNKSRYLNIGISKLRSQASQRWMIIKDSDIRLPSDFGSRLYNLYPFLSKETLYGLSGRRIASCISEFSPLESCEPWEHGLERLKPVVGYFNLFHQGRGPRLYPKSDSKRKEHDDRRFCQQFGSTAIIPVPCLHIGENNVSWGGAREYVGSIEVQKTPVQSALLSALNNVIENTCVVGIWSSKMIAVLANRADHVCVVDTRNLSQRSEDVLEEADRIFCWNRFVQDVADCPNVFLVGKVDMTPLAVPNSDEVRVRLPMRTAAMPEAVDLIHFGHEPSHEFIFEKLVPVLGKLKPGGWLSGTHYGLPGFPQTTSTIELLLGTPEVRDSAGGWALRDAGYGMRDARHTSSAKTLSRARSKERGVVLYVHDAADATRALTALFSLRQQFDSGVAVLMWGKEVPALRIACARFGAEYVSVMAAAKAGGDLLLQGSVSGEPAAFSPVQARLLAAGYSPFEATVLVGTEAAIPSVAKWWAAIRECRAHCVADTEGATLGFSRESAAFRRWQARLRKSQRGQIRAVLSTEAELRKAERIGSRRGKPLVSPAAEVALVTANPAHVWWPEGCTVVTAAMPDDLEALEANWRSIRWPAGMRRMLSTEGTKNTESLPRPFARQENILPAKGAKLRENYAPFPCPSVSSVDDLFVSDKVRRSFADQAYWIQAIVAAAAQCKTKRLLYLDPCMRPVPGAELFYREQDQAAAYASAGWCFVRRGKKVLKTPKLGPPATLFEVAFLKRAAKAFSAEKRERNFEVFLAAFAKKEKRAVTVQDVMPCGWNR